MRPLLTPRWSQLRRPVTPPTILSHRIRNFHATRPAPFAAEAVTLATGLLHGVHTVTGLPWVASIPLAAVLVRTFIGLPIMIWTRVAKRRVAEIKPLLHCIRKHYEDAFRAKAMEEHIYMRPSEAQAQLNQEMKKRTAALNKEWKVSKYVQFIPLLQIPFWLALMEGIRNMCGVNIGLLRYLVPLPDTNGRPSLDLPGAVPSLANEGALWFSDLLAGDLTGALPLILGISIVANLQSQTSKMTSAEASDLGKQRLIFYFIDKTIFGFLHGLGAWMAFTAYVTGMPAGMMLFWIASTNTATLQKMLLDKYLFATSPPKTLPELHVRLLKPGETKPRIESMLK